MKHLTLQWKQYHHSKSSLSQAFIHKKENTPHKIILACQSNFIEFSEFWPLLNIKIYKIYYIYNLWKCYHTLDNWLTTDTVFIDFCFIIFPTHCHYLGKTYPKIVHIIEPTYKHRGFWNCWRFPCLYVVGLLHHLSQMWTLLHFQRSWIVQWWHLTLYFLSFNTSWRLCSAHCTRIFIFCWFLSYSNSFDVVDRSPNQTKIPLKLIKY